jgi:uncharacterized membrane protein
VAWLCSVELFVVQFEWSLFSLTLLVVIAIVIPMLYEGYALIVDATVASAVACQLQVSAVSVSVER